MKKNTDITVEDWGYMPYKEAWEKQEAMLQETVARKIEGQTTVNKLIFVEHPKVFTLGKSGNINNVLLSEDELVEKDIAFYKTNRGGDITYHGPGQIVGYPIFDLENFKTDIGWYLRTMEQVIMNVLAQYHITAGRSLGETGVWLQPDVPGYERKICAMGVRCSRWVTMHGFALNVNNSLEQFDYIIPCGIQNKKVTSMQLELQQQLDLSKLKEAIAGQFNALFSA
jgi:lipoyl(octanoyl) transferase